jgi:hypothetical protein
LKNYDGYTDTQTDIQTRRQQGDLTSLLSFFQRKESGLNRMLILYIWTGFKWLRIGSKGRVLWILQIALGFYERRGIS